MPSTDWQEQIADDEEQRFERQGERMKALQRMRAQGSSTGRALHLKPTGCFEAELRVLDDLPEHARVGLFAEPAVLRAHVRFSNGSSSHQPDRAPDIRGLALKIFDVPGPKILPGLEDATTQDFLLIHTPTFPFRNSGDFVDFVWAARSKALALPRLLWRFGIGGFKSLVGKLREGLGIPVRSLATLRYHSVLPTRFGEHAARYHAIPEQSNDEPTKGEPSEDALREDLERRLQKGPLEWTLVAQFFEDETRTPIEDPTVDWKESDAPLVPIARLVIPKQDASSEQGQAVTTTIEAASFDPWHATEDFRPLGEIMRSRRAAYKVSAIGREAALDPTT